MTSWKTGHVLIAALSALPRAGCSAAGEAIASAGGPIEAVATTGVVGDALTAIAGELVSVRTLTGPGVDPHLEVAVGEVLEQMDGRTSTIAVAGQLPADQLISAPDYEGQYDPPVWFDVPLWPAAVERIRERSIELDPANEADDRASAEA